MNSEQPTSSEQELWRANTYHLLARLLACPPSHQMVAYLGEIPPLRRQNGEDAIALAWCQLGEAARQAREQSVQHEYEALFSSDGGLVPRAVHYLPVESHPKSLALLRIELAGLGMGSLQGREADHVGALCDTMGQLIEGEDPRQIGFFARHVKTWLPNFFHDLHFAPSADFYRPVGALGLAFLEMERLYLHLTR